MKQFFFKSALTTAIIASAVGNAQAQAQDNRFYAGFGAGYSKVTNWNDFSKQTNDIGTQVSKDNDGIAFKFMGGYQFTPMFGAEFMYTRPGSPEDKIKVGQDFIKRDMELNVFSLAGTVTFPLSDQFSILGKAGMYHARARFTVEGSGGKVTLKDSDNGFLAGAGLRYAINERISVQGEYEYFNGIGKEGNFKGLNIYMLSTSLVYHW